jgi:chorismate mutase
MGTMLLIRGELAIVVIFAIGVARAQSTIDKFLPLVETSARRLAIAQQVALAKWDSQAAVEDAPREAQVIMGAVKYGESRGLDQTFVSNFFRAQIEANKVVQYSLLADWNRAGTAPAHRPVDLATAIRPALDRLQIELVRELADIVAIRSSAGCRTDVAKAIGRYMAAHKHDAGPVQAIALDRALAATCTDK